jgi:hypothetical protein
MAIRPALRNVLEVVGSLAHYDINTNVVDTSAVQHGDSHSSLEVNDCLEELQSLGLIKMLQTIGDTKEKKDDEIFRLLNITKEGLEELLPNHQNKLH